MSKDVTYKRLIQAKEWRIVRAHKLSTQPTCERCKSQYSRIRAANCVHHIVPVEAGRTDDQMRDLCYSMSNLQSLCASCHSEIHAAERSHSKEQVVKRADERHNRWREQHTLQGPSRLPTPGACFYTDTKKLPNPLALSRID